ncbi:flagellar biosynthesis protein FlhB [Geomicrobium sediminis]|uniref:Flagellar biosynthetic protein FlhB n=1 Tax=Geomicrobium sediminis TaxID=1347788 RepID=A0ABS2PCT2_9BACL|nr:flagellar biosynthesis protein FlhB [Geomicrobium sediminis]MBM7632608.1 flagellar biosynthetic protein FlhB [Geomicrobium sediminis]
MLSMDLQYFSGEKTEKATPKKRQDTRKKGQVPKSTDINTALILLIVFIFLFVYAAVPAKFMQDLFYETYINYASLSFTVEDTMGMFQGIVIQMGIVIIPILLVAALTGVIASMVQVGVLFAPEVIKPKLSKINPLKGFKRIFSARALVELVKALLKIVLVGTLAFGILWMFRDDLLMLGLYDVLDGYYVVSLLTGMIGVASAILLLILAIPDLVYQRFDHEKQIRMSKHDVKDEFKKMEGDPLIKAKRRQKAQDLAMQRMMQEVPKADVVITNPTHYAVALKYDDSSMTAPKVIGKGVDYMALRIRKIATDHDIAIVENRPLARALYDGTDVDDEVPEDLFRAVAEVLAYVYRLENETKQRGN